MSRSIASAAEYENSLLTAADIVSIIARDDGYTFTAPSTSRRNRAYNGET